MEKTTLNFNVGPGGWLFALVASGFGSAAVVTGVHLRLWRDDDGRWRPQGTLFVNPEHLQRIPMRRILLAVAASESLREKLASRLGDEVPGDPGSEAFMRAFDDFVVPEPPPVALKRPKGRNLSDEFYKAVADAYRVALERSEAPRTAIAESAGVSNEVAGRWVRQARKRGYLPATEPGKVSA